ncbi:hypothetical protein ABK040_003046 [Willaertia magna]
MSNNQEDANNFEDEALKEFKEGSIHFQKHFYSKAIQHYEEAIEIISKNSNEFKNILFDGISFEILIKSLTSKGLCYFNEQKWESANKDFDESISLFEQFKSKLNDDDLNSIVLSIIKANHMKGKSIQLGNEYNSNFENVDENVTKIISLFNYYMSRGLLQNQLQQFDLAIDDFTQCVTILDNTLQNKLLNNCDNIDMSQINHDYYVTLHNRGISYENLQNYEMALHDYNAAINYIDLSTLQNSLQKNNVIDTFYYRARLNDQFLQNKSEAEKDYLKILTLQKDHILANYYLGEIYYFKKNYKLSQNYFTIVIDNLCDNVDNNVDNNEKLFYSHFNRGMCYKNCNEFENAINDFELAINTNKEIFYKVFIELARLYTKLQLKTNEELVTLYNQGISLLEKSPSTTMIDNKSHIYFERGILYNKLDNYQSAIKDFTTTIQLDPNFIDAYFNRGFINHRKLKLFEKAIEDYDKVIYLNPYDVDCENQKVMCLIELEREEEAKVLVQEILERNPENETTMGLKRYLNNEDNEEV